MSCGPTGRPNEVRDGNSRPAEHADDVGRMPRGKRITHLLLLRHSKIESAVRYLDIEVDDAIEIAEKSDI